MNTNWGRGKRQLNGQQVQAILKKRGEERARRLASIQRLLDRRAEEKAMKKPVLKKLPKKPKCFNIFDNILNSFEHVKREYKSRFESGYAFVHFLEKRGFTIIGSGAYSKILAKGDSKRVIKVCRSPDMWIDYVLWANKAGYAGGFAPRIFSYKYFPGKDNTNGSKNPFYVAIVERMEKTASRLDYSHGLSFIHSLFYLSIHHDNDNATAVIDLVLPGIGKFANDFKGHFGKNDLDLHGGNFMVRSDGTYALTDPLAGYTQSDLKRIRYTDLEVKIAA